jgi:hypothetical protein
MTPDATITASHTLRDVPLFATVEEALEASALYVRHYPDESRAYLNHRDDPLDPLWKLIARAPDDRKLHAELRRVFDRVEGVR